VLATSVHKRIIYGVVIGLAAISLYFVGWYYYARNIANTELISKGIVHKESMLQFSNLHLDGHTNSFVIEWHSLVPNYSNIYINTYTPYALVWLSCNEVQYHKRYYKY